MDINKRITTESQNKINIYKNIPDDDLDLDNNISIERDAVKSEYTNNILMLTKNKSKLHNPQKINFKKQHLFTKQYLEGKINAPSLDLKRIQIKKLKYQDDDIIPSSNRYIKTTENEIDNEITQDFDEIDIYNNLNKDSQNNDNDNNNKDINEKNMTIYRTEDSFIKNENEVIIKPEDLFLKIISINLDIKITNEELNMFFFNRIPKDETLITNININCPDKNGSNILFNYNLEIIRNYKIYYFAKIIKYFPKMKIKIYISNIDNFSQMSYNNKNINSNYTYVGKIISNMMRTNFIVFAGNKKDNYEKRLEINYSMNIFGLLGVREMKVDKYINNNISCSLCNSKPKWDYQYNNYKMDFNGRVKQISKKNFLLVDCSTKNDSSENNEEDEQNKNILQCGKIDDKTFALDFISPLSPFEAFSICITSLVTKISCE